MKTNMQKILSINIVIITIALMIVGAVTDNKKKQASKESAQSKTTFEISKDGYVSWVKVDPAERYHVIISGDTMDIRPQ